MLIPIICAENLRSVKKAERTGAVQTNKKSVPILRKGLIFYAYSTKMVEVAGPPSKARMNSELAEGEFIKLHEPSINENYTGSLKRFLKPTISTNKEGGG